MLLVIAVLLLAVLIVAFNGLTPSQAQRAEEDIGDVLEFILSVGLALARLALQILWRLAALAALLVGAVWFLSAM